MKNIPPSRCYHCMSGNDKQANTDRGNSACTLVIISSVRNQEHRCPHYYIHVLSRTKTALHSSQWMCSDQDLILMVVDGISAENTTSTFNGPLSGTTHERPR